MTTNVKQQTENVKRSTEELFNDPFYEFAREIFHASNQSDSSKIRKFHTIHHH